MWRGQTEQRKDTRHSLALRLLSDDRGATMVEYGMMIALIAITVMGALYMLGGALALKLNQVASCLSQSC
jgi:pilus assembly protein Flp/PilA